MKILKIINNLGKTPLEQGYLGGISYLDAFWKVVTWIGNTLGLVRMIWTAFIKDAGAAVKFIPNEAVQTEYFNTLKEKLYIEDD